MYGTSHGLPKQTWVGIDAHTTYAIYAYRCARAYNPQYGWFGNTLQTREVYCIMCTCEGNIAASSAENCVCNSRLNIISRQRQRNAWEEALCYLCILNSCASSNRQWTKAHESQTHLKKTHQTASVYVGARRITTMWKTASERHTFCPCHEILSHFT